MTTLREHLEAIRDNYTPPSLAYDNAVAALALLGEGEKGVLTPRQTQVMLMLADGYSCRGIADLLALSVETVRYHTKGAYRNLGVNTRADAIAAIESVA